MIISVDKEGEGSMLNVICSRLRNSNSRSNLDGSTELGIEIVIQYIFFKTKLIVFEHKRKKFTSQNHPLSKTLKTSPSS